MNKPPYVCLKCGERYGPMPSLIFNQPLYMACKCSNIKDNEILFVDLNKMEIKGKIENIGEPMTQKTENLTEKEAWIALANGECVGTWQYIHRINYGHVEFWDGKWLFTGRLSVGPYSIVPDPSKPKEVEDEYKTDRDTVHNNIEHAANSANSYGDQAIITAVKLLFGFVQEHFQRKP